MGKITYLIGAGASRNCLPVVDDIPEYMIKFRDWLQDLDQPRKHFYTPPSQSEDQGLFNKFREEIIALQKTIVHNNRTWDEVRIEMIRDLTNMHKESKNYASIDTYAKKIFISEGVNSIKYLKTKTLLSLLFIWVQQTIPPDYRYDSFFASILEKDAYSLPKNIRIISWNYDYQFEKAFSTYVNLDDLLKTQKLLSVYEPQTYTNTVVGEFSIFKINGTTNFLDRSEPRTKERCFYNEMSKGSNQQYASFINQYAECYGSLNKINPLLGFAWERGPREEGDYFEALKYSCRNSDALVIIGYSFPYFNRSIDKLILENFATSKIYVQDVDPETVINNLTSYFPEKNRGDIIPLTVNPNKKGQFHIPFELDK